MCGVSGQGHAAAVVVPGNGEPVGIMVAPRIRALWDPQVGGAERLCDIEGCFLYCGQAAGAVGAVVFWSAELGGAELEGPSFGAKGVGDVLGWLCCCEFASE